SKDDERRNEILSDAITVYENIIQSYIELKQYDKAIEYAERSRSRRLVDLMASSSMPQSDCYLYYTDISCPRRIWVETPRISVVVRLRIKPPKYNDAPVQELSVNTELPVRVRISAEAFNILSDREQEITVQPEFLTIPLSDEAHKWAHKFA
ncbi:MAG: hypothetical protein ACKPE3_28510, partial [Sphaerospermopsis kisseleviana]